MSQHSQTEGRICKHRCGRTRWHVRHEWRDALLGSQGLRLEEWLAAGLARVVKQGANRAVYRVELPGRGAVFVKHFRPQSWRDSARAFARGSLARYEWSKICEVVRRGLPTALPLAWGEESRADPGRDSYLVTQAIDGVVSLQELLDSLPSRPPAEATRLRRDLLDELVDLWSACHKAGVRQRDIHTGNILVQTPACGGGERHVNAPQASSIRLYLIDLPSVRFSRPLDWGPARDNLGVLCAVMRRYSTPGERWRFWVRYLAARRDLVVGNPRDAAEAILRRADASSQRVARSRDRRCWGDNRDYHRLDTPQGRVYGASDVPRQRLAALAADPEGPLRACRHRAIKLSHASVVVEAELPTATGATQVAYKRSRRKRRWKAPLDWLRRPRALAGWQLAHALTIRGIATARPLAAYQSGPGDGYLATEWLAGAENLHLYGWRLASLPTAERLLRARRCMRRLGELIGRMHAWQVSHRDLKAGNLAVVDAPLGAEALTDVAVYLLDLDGVRLTRRLSHSARTHNLARMAVSLRLHPWVSRTLRLRFLLAYVRACGVATLAWKPLWRDVDEACRRMVAQRERRGRMVA